MTSPEATPESDSCNCRRPPPRSLVTFLFFVIASLVALLGGTLARAHEAEARAALLERIRYSATRVTCEDDYSAEDEAHDPPPRVDPDTKREYGLDRL